MSKWKDLRVATREGMVLLSLDWEVSRASYKSTSVIGSKRGNGIPRPQGSAHDEGVPSPALRILDRVRP